MNLSAYRFPSMNFTNNDCRLYEDAKYLKYIINSMIKNLCSEKLIGTFFCTTNIPIQIINTCICFVIVPQKMQASHFILVIESISLNHAPEVHYRVCPEWGNSLCGYGYETNAFLNHTP